MRSDATGDNPEIPDRRWRQCSVIPHEALVSHMPDSPDALHILLTQDCDILHHDYAAEPDIELHIARPIDEADGDLLHAKNPRRLQFTIANRSYEIRMHERCRVPRGCLLGHVPRELDLGEDLIRTIIRWTANRYLRSAFLTPSMSDWQSRQDR